MLQLKGILKVKLDEAQVSEKFKKRDFVLNDVSSQYPQLITFQLTQDRCSLIDPFEIGDEITVNFNLRGREWTDPKTSTVKYFNTIEAWKIELVTRAQSPAQQQSSQPTQQSNPGTFTSRSSDESDDLPF